MRRAEVDYVFVEKHEVAETAQVGDRLHEQKAHQFEPVEDFFGSVTQKKLDLVFHQKDGFICNSFFFSKMRNLKNPFLKKSHRVFKILN